MKSVKKKLMSVVFMFTLILAILPFSVSADVVLDANGNLPAQPVVSSEEVNFGSLSPLKIVSPLASTDVATVTVNASTSGSGSSSSNTSGHAWITVTNISTSNITVGKLSNIAPGKSVTIGTWGNKDEHKGVWYNLEGYFKNANDDAYKTRASLSMNVDSAGLTTVTNYIKNNDKWELNHNCSSFAKGLWNEIASSSNKVGNGAIINTPTALYNSIKDKSGYSTSAAIPFNYKVYYAQGTGTPILSSDWN